MLRGQSSQLSPIRWRNFDPPCAPKQLKITERSCLVLEATLVTFAQGKRKECESESDEKITVRKYCGFSFTPKKRFSLHTFTLQLCNLMFASSIQPSRFRHVSNSHFNIHSP